VGPGFRNTTKPSTDSSFSALTRPRSRETGGSGLGLSIMSAIMAGLGGSVELKPSDLGGLCVSLQFPDDVSQS
jgi:two-component system OmpR family sensor kinase